MILSALCVRYVRRLPDNVDVFVIILIKMYKGAAAVTCLYLMHMGKAI